MQIIGPLYSIVEDIIQGNSMTMKQKYLLYKQSQPVIVASEVAKFI